MELFHKIRIKINSFIFWLVLKTSTREEVDEIVEVLQAGRKELLKKEKWN